MKLLTLAATLLIAISVSAQQPAETILIHGNILTGAHLRNNDPSATPAKVTAIAIANGKILAAGEDATILKLKGPKTQVIDLHGAFAMPGFNDAHTHIGEAGRMKLSVDLVGAHSLAEMQQRIRTFVATAKPGTWIQGGGWDHTLWADDKLPTRTDLDAVTGDHPALLRRVDGHMAVANSAALAAANITSATPDPPAPKSTVTPPATPPESCAKPPPIASSPAKFRHQLSKNAAKPSPSPLPTSSPTASLQSRTTPTGKTSWPSKS